MGVVEAVVEASPLTVTDVRVAGLGSVVGARAVATAGVRIDLIVSEGVPAGNAALRHADGSGEPVSTGSQPIADAVETAGVLVALFAIVDRVRTRINRSARAATIADFARWAVVVRIGVGGRKGAATDVSGNIARHAT